MNKRLLGIGVAAVLAVAATAVVMRWPGKPDGAVAQAPQQQGQRSVSVEVGTAVRRKTPVLLEGLGTVTPMASVGVKTRIDNEIVGVHFQDGAKVEKGDLLITLDTRALDAQIRQVEGNIARDQAQLEGAERDARRYTELVAKNATPIVNLDNAKTQSDMFRAAMKADQAALENLKVQLSYCTIRAPISGRISQAAVKVGNFVRSADLAPIAIIHQMAPLYVTFTIPQKHLPDVRHAIASETANVEIIIPGETRHSSGVVTMIENTVDPTTGMATVRATMPNTDELLWPGTLVNAQMTLRTEDAVVVPSAAVQVSQTGPFVYVVKNGVATVQPVKVARTIGQESVIEQGLEGGETVVTDGHLLLTNGARVTPRDRRAGT
jgi:membrane fusion protein, multidrug efflux system